MSVRNWLAGGFAVAIVAAVGTVPSHAGKVKGLTPGTMYVVPNGELLFGALNPTSKAITVKFDVVSPEGDWQSTSHSASVPSGQAIAISLYCADTSYCGGVPVISPATVVPSIRWQPLTGGYDFIPAGGFRTMR